MPKQCCNRNREHQYVKEFSEKKSRCDLEDFFPPPNIIIGPRGPPGGGAIIPYASGFPVTVTTILGGLVGTVAVFGFGSSFDDISLLFGNIDLSAPIGEDLINFAFSVPRNGAITSIAATFSSTIGLSLPGTTITLQVQLFRSSATSNLFVPIGSPLILTPSITGVLSIGDISSGIATLNIPVLAGERLLLVLSATATGITLVNSVVGTLSAGVSIA